MVQVKICKNLQFHSESILFFFLVCLFLVTKVGFGQQFLVSMFQNSFISGGRIIQVKFEFLFYIFKLSQIEILFFFQGDESACIGEVLFCEPIQVESFGVILRVHKENETISV